MAISLQFLGDGVLRNFIPDKNRAEEIVPEENL